MDGWNLLHFAATNECPEVALKLVEQLLKEPEVDAGVLSSKKFAAFAMAATMMNQHSKQPEYGQQKNQHSTDNPCSQCFQALKLLLERTTLSHSFDTACNTPFSYILLVACERCWRESLLLFKHHPQIGSEAKIIVDSQNPLHSLLLWGVPLSRVGFLLNIGADAAATAFDGRTALRIMLENWPDVTNGIKLIRFSCDRGVDVNTPCTLDRAPLMVAVSKKKLGFIRTLLDKKSIDTSVTHFETGEGIWHLALRSTNPLQIIEILRQRSVQAPINLENRMGTTPLYTTLTLSCDGDVIEALIAAGSNILNPNSHRVSCLEYIIGSRLASSVSFDT